MSTAAVVLAAGSSQRLGHPKQTVMLGGQTLVERATNVAIEAGLSPVIVVLRDYPLLNRLKQLGAHPLLNTKCHEGMASSIRSGVKSAAHLNATGIVLMTCDQVALRPDHLRALTSTPGRIAGSRYAGKVGIPAYFPASSFPALLALQGDVGARDLLHDAASIENESLALDIDTEYDLRQAKKLFEPQHLP